MDIYLIIILLYSNNYNIDYDYYDKIRTIFNLYNILDMYYIYAYIFYNYIIILYNIILYNIILYYIYFI